MPGDRELSQRLYLHFWGQHWLQWLRWVCQRCMYQTRQRTTHSWVYFSFSFEIVLLIWLNSSYHYNTSLRWILFFFQWYWENVYLECINYYSAPIPTLECDNGNIKALFSRANDKNLEEKFITIFEPVPGAVCNLQKSTDANFVSISIPFDECGTNVNVRSRTE